ncbi:MAG: ATP-dependent helicase [Candidatus Blackburnbacteria bacterium]|nr:ATP-dependent helicase [Candidatus Blackburnbacteria bacterium]
MRTDVTLNDQQRVAVQYGEGSLLIIAGAGTGKTTVITERVKYLILERNVLSSELLALTFTEKASREMEERVDVAMPYGYAQMWISTFHSFGDRILRNEAVHIGLDPRYRLITEAEAIRFIREHLFEFELVYFRPLGNPTRFLSGMFQHFCRLKDEDICAFDYVKWAEKQKGRGRENEKWLELAHAYFKYEELKNKYSVMDFSDLISNTLKLFRERPNVLEQYQKQFNYILVDEFQDTNIAQYELIKLLAPPSKNANLTVVGDDSQSIYKFRGAAISNILNFMKDYKGAEIAVLTKNYRSTQAILDRAYQLIQHNNPDTLEAKLGIDKNLVSVKEQRGQDVEFIHADRVENEAELIVKKILQLLEEEKRSFSDFAILVRANNHSEPFVQALSRAGLPYQFLGPGQLFRQPEVKELIAYLKVLYNFEDSIAFYKVLSMEHFDIPARDLAVITNYARRVNVSLFEAAERVNEIFVSEGAKKKVLDIVAMIHNHLKLVPSKSAGYIVYRFLEESGILQFMGSSKNATDEKRTQNIARFFDKLKTYETDHEDASIFAVVDWIELSLDLGESPLASNYDWAREDAVNILTVHSSKGLEFPVVFVVNLVDQRFPTRERSEQIPIPDELIKEVLPQGNYHLQEERRLFYVAMTRARERLYLTAADYYGEGKREKKISLFVPEALGVEVLQKKAKKVEQLLILDYSPLDREPFQGGVLQPITYLSYSQIDCFNFCPLHYKLRYVLKIPTPPTAALSFGNTLHATLKNFCELPKSEMGNEEKKILEIYDRNWISEGYTSRLHEEKMKKRGREYLLDYLKTDLHSTREPLALERPFTLSIGKFLKVGGKIDRVDRTENGIEIIDYKTTDLSFKDLPTSRELEKDLQLSVYALAATMIQDPIFSKMPEQIKLSLYYLDKGTKVSTTRTAKQLEVARKDILRMKEEIEKSDFVCSGNFWCKSCEYKLFCEVSGN